MYELPEIDFKKIKNKVFVEAKKTGKPGFAVLVLGLVLLASFSVADLPVKVKNLAQFFDFSELLIPGFKADKTNAQTDKPLYVSAVAYEEAVINAVKSASPSVVSIVISKNVPVYEQEWINPFGGMAPGFDIQIPQFVEKGKELQDIGAGSGFIVSEDGLVLTNKHVVSDTQAEYTVFTNDGQKYSANVLALDPAQDLAVIKIPLHSGIPLEAGQFQPAKLGNSDDVQIGQTAIAIGNALGQFSNTISVGVVSGLQRTISASDRTGAFSETLQGIIQTDAAINSGNSGGPLLNLRGEVIGINTAVADNAQSIGFAIPINMAKRDIDQVKTTGEIIYPFLGIRYVSIDAAVQAEFNLPVSFGAYILKGPNGESAVTAGSAAETAGLKENDVVLEINSEKITNENSLSNLILKYNPGDKVNLKILRGNEEMNVEVTLGKR